MSRHPIDPISTVLGIVAVTLGAVVASGASPGFDPGWVVALAVLMAGFVLIPWPDLLDGGHRAGAAPHDDGNGSEPDVDRGVADQPSWSS